MSAAPPRADSGGEEDEEALTPRVVAIGVDGSGPSDRAFRTAVDRFLTRRDFVLLVSVEEPDAVISTSAVLRDYTRVLRDLACEFEVVQLEGEPSSCLLETVTEQGVDFLFIGAKGTGRTMERVGATALSCVRYAECSVMMLRD